MLSRENKNNAFKNPGCGGKAERGGGGENKEYYVFFASANYIWSH